MGESDRNGEEDQPQGNNGIDKIKKYANMVIYSCFIFIVDPLDCGSLNKKVQDLGIAR